MLRRNNMRLHDQPSVPPGGPPADIVRGVLLLRHQLHGVGAARPLGVQIAAKLHLDPAQKGLMVAVPILAGAVLRVVNGVLVDRIGPKLTGSIGQVIVLAATFDPWTERSRPKTANQFEEILVAEGV